MPLKKNLPNNIFFVQFKVAEELFGKNGLNSVLNYVHLQKFKNNYPPNDLNAEHTLEDFTRFMQGVIDIFGEPALRPVMYRGGMIAFDIIKEHLAAAFNVERIQKRGRTRDELFDEMCLIYKMMLDGGKEIFGDVFHVYETSSGLINEIKPCYWCMGLTSKKPICYEEIGFIVALSKWVIGEPVKVEEVKCIAKGDPACQFVVHRPSTRPF